MADLAAGDVTYTILRQGTMGNSKKQNLVKLVFGDASLTHPSAGIPITKGKMGCPTTIESVDIVGQNVGSYRYQYDRTNEKLIAYNVNVTSGLFVASTAAPAATSLEVIVIGY